MKIGSFEIDDFIGFPVSYLDKHLGNYGFNYVPIFNDYIYKWICHESNTSILAHIYFADNQIDGCCEIIDTIKIFNNK